MSPQLQHEHSTRITEKLRSRLVLKHIGCVAGYMANDGEVDLSNAFKWFQEHGIRVTVPYLREGVMRFALLQPKQRLLRGPFGIREPDYIEQVQMSNIDLILVPLVAFSSVGERLGRGGGYYDRALDIENRPLTLGIAHEFQLSDKFSTSEMDVAMDAIVTENNWRLFNSSMNAVLRAD